tara:strand:+ start:1183 stop:1614 length:432 start_codon:yes stop_codon:yes gene_type:complete
MPSTQKNQLAKLLKKFGIPVSMASKVFSLVAFLYKHPTFLNLALIHMGEDYKMKKSELRKLIREELRTKKPLNEVRGTGVDYTNDIYKTLNKSPDKRIKAYASQLAEALATILIMVEEESIMIGDVFIALNKLKKKGGWKGRK